MVPTVLPYGMPTCIHEQGGVLMQVSYEMGEDKIPTIHGVHLLDADYKPTGPDIRLMLDSMVQVTGPDEGAYVLSLVTEYVHELEGTGCGGQPT